uniref:EGF-like domain-containing protein n=1 Tax=Caenorhabditis tropicalis TaxID=1561998 RepID=A0A1I7UNH0_9PELO
MAPALQALGLLLLAGLAVGVQYEVRGNIDLIRSYDIHPDFYDETFFTEKLEKVSKRIADIIGPDFKDFFVFDYKIHGEDTTVFHAHLSLVSNPSISRQDIIDRIVATDDVQIYFLRQNEFEVKEESVSRFRAVRPDVSSCLHGGILLPNATCSCLPYYSGANCEVVSCRNNGIGQNGRCVCPPGIYSSHCEARMCVTKIDSVVDFSSQSFIIVINTKTSMAFDLSTIIEKVQVLFTDYQSQGIVVSSYIATVYRYSNSVYFMETVTFTTSDDLVKYLQSVTVGPGTVGPQNEDQPTLDAIYMAQSSQITMRPKSFVYVFADSENTLDPTPSTLLSNTNESMVIQQTLAWRNKIVLFISQWTATPIEPTGNHFDVLRRVITAVHGDLLIIDKTELEDVFNHLLFYYIGGQNTFVQYYNNVTKSIPILSDAPTQSTYVMLSVENGASIPNVQDSSGKMLTPLAFGKRYSLFRVYQSATDSVTITGDTLPLHNTRVWFTSPDDVLISYSDDDTVDNNYAHTFNGFRQRPSVYSSFATTTALTISRLDSYNSSVILPASAFAAKDATCVFQYKLSAVSTCIPGPFVHNVVVGATDGNKYRAVPGYCFTPDTHVAPLWSCINNGTRSGVASCNCAANWGGLHCEVPKCLNGGTPDKFPNGNGHGNCICPFGISGSFCEILTCATTSPDTFQSYNRSFALVVQNSLSANQALTGLNKGLKFMLNQGQSTDFEDFVLTTFKARTINGASVPDITSSKFSSASAFINASTDDGIGYSYSPKGFQPGLFAVETTLKSMDYDKSSIFLFTDSDSLMNETSLDFTEIIQKLVERQIEISIVIIPPYGSSDLCPTGTFFQIYEDLAVKTGGNLINLCQPYTTSGDPVSNFIASYGSTHHHTEVITSYDIMDCNLFLSRSFYISSSTNHVYVVVYSPTIASFNASVIDVVNAGTTQYLVPDAHSVPFFASYQIKIAAGSSLQYVLQLNGSSPGQCYVRVTEQSQFSAYLGFSPDPSFDLFSKDLTYGTRQQPVLHLSSTLQSDPIVSMSAFDVQDNFVFKDTFTKRTSGCKYEYIMKNEFACHKAGDSFIMETTITTNEVTIMRTQRAFCMDLVGCINGGIMLGGSCQCINGYTSIHCEYPVCQNGGTVDDFKCLCDAKHDGATCQYTKCNDWNFVETHDPREYNFQQIVFVVEVNTKNMVLPGTLLQKNIQSFVDATDDVNVPKQYTLVTFDDTNIRVIVSSAQKDVFVAAFQKGVTVGLNTPDKVKGLEAINTAYSTLVDLPGIVYVFTTSPSASSVAAVRQRYGVQVNVVWMGTDLTPVNINYYYTAIARQSNGRILSVNPLNTQQILSALTPSVLENQLILDDAAKDCTSGVTFRFPVGNLATTLTLVATGTGVSVTVTDEKNNNVDLRNSSTFTDVNTLIRTISTVGHSGGTWNVVVKSSSNCFLQARVNSPLQVIPRFTNDQGDDFGSGTPRVGAGSFPESYITFRIMDSYNSDSNNFGSSISVIESADTDPETPWATTTNFSNTTVLVRDPVGCASQFVTPLISWTSTYMKFIVRGKDSNNNNFQRTFFFNKSGNKADCQNGAGVDTLGFCLCDSNHWGSLCQFRYCKNGGVSAYGLCDCPNGYFGQFCEQYLSA